MKYTANYNLKKPDETDVVNVKDLNDNADIIDSELKKTYDKAVDAPVKSVNGKTGAVQITADDVNAMSNRTATQFDLDPDTTEYSTILTNHANAPDSGYWYIITIKHGSTWSNNRTQIATSYVGTKSRMFTRHNYDGTWSPWTEYVSMSDFNAHKKNLSHVPYTDDVVGEEYSPTQYNLIIKGVGNLFTGMGFSFKSPVSTEGIPIAIKVASAPTRWLMNSNNNIVKKMKEGSVYTVRYNGSNFILQGEGGEYGTADPSDVIKGKTIGTEEGIKTGTLELTGDAVPADVLSGKTFYQTNPKAKSTGTMPNNGKINRTITTQGGQIVVPEGYHNGSGIVKAHFANLTPPNVRKGVNIGNVVGILETVEFDNCEVINLEINQSFEIDNPKGISVYEYINLPNKTRAVFFPFASVVLVQTEDSGASLDLYVKLFNDKNSIDLQSCTTYGIDECYFFGVSAIVGDININHSNAQRSKDHGNIREKFSFEKTEGEKYLTKILLRSPTSPDRGGGHARVRTIKCIVEK